MLRRTIRWLPLLALVAAGGAGAAMAATASRQVARATVQAERSSAYGMVLVAANGHTLYRFTPDTKGHSTCTGACLKLWPPLLVKAGTRPQAGAGAKASLLGTLKAVNGKAQVTYAGFPLYFFAGDKTAGATKGQGLVGKWYVVDTAGALVKKAAAGSATSGGTNSSGGSSTTGSGGGGAGWG